ncbi:hypothetical protein CMI41_03465 [Candidatus Pacearchaeota archaeon]|nr:hypothetical protein [Candidatus Pacearchaeota archaeon]
MAESTKDILDKYGKKLDGEIKDFDSKVSDPNSPDFTKSYEKFRQAMNPAFNRYEKLANSLGRILTFKVGEKDRTRLQKEIDIAHLNVTPSEVLVLALIAMTLTIVGGALFSLALWLIIDFFSFMMVFLFLILSAFLFFYFVKKPEKLALEWRLKASSQMVPAILYIVVYMKHTSNFERAVEFAAQHLDPPLSLDLRKVFWDVEVGKYSTLKESIDNYLGGWKDYSTEFIEAFHLIESSLYEPGEKRRVEVLERALQVILDGVYDKMLKYTHEVKSPLTNVYMLGIVLPTLALAILPLASTMMDGAIQWFHVLFLFNLIIPFFVVYLTGNAINKRPGGYGDTSLLENNPYYPKFIGKRPYVIGGLVAVPFILLGLLPLIWMYSPLYTTYGDPSFLSLGITILGDAGIFGIIELAGGGLSGPHGLLSLLLSLLVPLGVALMFIIAFNLRTKDLIKARDKYKALEGEFTSSLFSLGNRIGDGLPAEIAFSRVAESSKGTSTEGFFSLVNQNIQQFGMSLEKALFDSRRGAVVFYPSSLVVTSMKILVQSVKKGLTVASKSLMSLSDYVKNIKKVNDRLNDLLADITSDMKSNMTFLAPLLGGIIVGLSGMITLILTSLLTFIESGVEVGSSASSGIDINQITTLFYVGNMIPTYWLQLIVGIYLIQVVFILTGTLVIIRSGQDILAKVNETGKNLRTTIILYVVVALFAILGLAAVAAFALKGMVG